MSKRTFYTNITPLPSQITRKIAVDELHDHGIMIKLNPLVQGFERCQPHKEASADEYHCIWYEITDKVSYLPGVSGQVKYKACFFDRPIGLQTHCYAPAGLDIKAKWSVGGNMAGEPREARELGVDTPRDGLYLREEVDMRCNMLLTSFVKKNLRNAHKVLVDRLLKKVEFTEEGHYQRAMTSTSLSSGAPSAPSTPIGHHPQQYLPQRSDGSVIAGDETGTYQPGSMSAPLGSPNLQQQTPLQQQQQQQQQQQYYLQQQQLQQQYQYNNYPNPNQNPNPQYQNQPQNDPRFSGPPPQYWQHPDQKLDPNMGFQKTGSGMMVGPGTPGQGQQQFLQPHRASFTAELPGSNVPPVEIDSRPSSVMLNSPNLGAAGAGTGTGTGAGGYPRPPSTVVSGSGYGDKAMSTVSSDAGNAVEMEGTRMDGTRPVSMGKEMR